MLWRTFIFAFLTAGALAVKPELSGLQRKSVKYTLTAVCNMTGGGGDVEDKGEQLTNSLQSFYDCVYPIVDTDTLKAEIKNATADGTLDEVFKTYCGKTPELKTCFHSLIDAFSPCVVESAKNQLLLAKNGTDQFFDYLCYKDGNRIIQFLTENGTDCVKSKTKEINACADTAQSRDTFSFKKLLSLTLAEKCGKFDELSSCIVESLKTCTPSTPGNMLEAIVGYMRKGSVCNDALRLTPQ